MLLLTLVALTAAQVPFTPVKPRTLCLATKPKDRHLPYEMVTVGHPRGEREEAERGGSHPNEAECAASFIAIGA